MAVLTFGFKLPAICTAKFTLRASLAERLAKVDFKNSAPLAALTLSLAGINLTWPFPVLEGVSSDPQFFACHRPSITPMAQCGTRCLGDTMRAVLEIFLRNAPNGKIVVLNDQHCDEIVAHQTQNATQPGNVYPR